MAKISENDFENERPENGETEDCLDERLNAQKEQYMRLLAEYDNYRKRSLKEKEKIYSDSKIGIVTEFLPVYDNLDRALCQETEDTAYKKGIEMTMNQLKAAFEKLGVREIPALGESFDPRFHSAMMHVEDENEGEGVIVEEFQRGFMLGDFVIRCSLVKVAN